MDACVGSQDTYESSLNRNLAMNEGSVWKAPLPASHLGSHVPTGARGSWSGWSVRLGGGRHMFLGCCHHGNGSYCRICVQRKGRHMEP